MKNKIRLLVVNDQRVMREGLRILLEAEPDLMIVGEAENGREALDEYEHTSPDVVLMDTWMPAMDGVETTRKLRRAFPDSRVIMLAAFEEDANILGGLRAGAVGWLPKDVSGEKLAAAIRAAAAEGALIHPSKLSMAAAELTQSRPEGLDSQPVPLPDPLNEREAEILRLLAQGLTNREIAARLYLAEGTIKNYVSNILSKIGVRDRTQAALRARELGLV